MSLKIGKAICLHAQAEDLAFLRPVAKRLGKLLNESFRYCYLTGKGSESEARRVLGDARDHFVIILAHGGTGYIRGAEHFDPATQELLVTEKFLTKRDASIFSDKVVFCLSCNSNSLARASLDSGAHTFVGFNDVPFDRFDDQGNPVGRHPFVVHAQALLLKVILATLERFCTGHATIEQAVEFLRLYICKTAVQFVRDNRLIKERFDIAALLLRVKDGVVCHGQGGVSFMR